ncbi:hypothetical protein ACM39_11755 [Chryseobacterium sp. FH2]|uniref:hypothetical protein n=1 Tax=Chryseobacterium sp. FH2 TaxID=1674291 RepID=UPI00065AB2E8|nr:hypothetical protein [Chryseobacterium sp. FH2]KMQ67544.1 hypothetical protein ACM39_11755 [Chryseobacterium sp. FH2]
MKILRPFLLFISLLLFGWLFVSNANQINVAATFNEDEINSEISKINSFTNIDMLKGYSIQQINSLETSKERSFQSAIGRIFIILILVLIQIVIYATKGNFTNSKATDF